MKWYTKLLITYGVCAVLAVLGAYLDRNDIPPYPMTTTQRVVEVFMFSLFIFALVMAIWGIGKLVSMLFNRKTA